MPHTAPVTLHQAPQLHLRHQDPAPDPAAQQAVDEHWHRLAASSPHMYDGPLVAVTGVSTAPAPAGITLSWGVSSYRHYLARHAPGPVPYARSLYTAVLQPADDGRVVVGQMHSGTTDPGRLQLPGGGVEPPPAGTTLDMPRLLEDGRRELAEETGIDHGPGQLRLWGVKTGGSHADVGVVCLAPPLPAEQINAMFDAHLKRCAETRTDPELVTLYLATSPNDPVLPDAPRVDYLDTLLATLAKQQPTSP